MKISVRESAGRSGKRWGRWLRRRARRLMLLLGENEAELSLLLAGDRLMLALNRKWRGRDRPTDVLAFSQAGKNIWGRGRLLGDVVICLPQAKRQATEAGHSLQRELLVLLVHGVLHLLGYDHEGASAAEARRMWRKQAKLVQMLGGA